jgi:two-component system NtrC family response regulator
VPNPKLLIVDDDEGIRSQLKWALSAEFEVSFAKDRASALRIYAEEQPPVVLLDLGLPPTPSDNQEGLATLADMVGGGSFTKVIIISCQEEKQSALQAIGMGAYDFLAKPLQIEELRIILKRALTVAALEKEHRILQDEMKVGAFEGMVGSSSRMQEVFGRIRKVATTDAPVLVLGESGTGKEMVALAIHHLSGRRGGPFVAINCGAIPETLLESELFGHEKGSFTGAHVQRKGRIETASGGTLFLDEIGELPAMLQVKLLRFLQEQSIERVGGRQPIVVDTRVVAATNVDLKKAIAEGRFREDLFYRIAVVVVTLPPLRERENDIPLLARDFLRRSALEVGRKSLAFDPDALLALRKHAWPGNVRELENRVKRAVIMAEGKRITVADLELAASEPLPQPANLKEAREQAEREVILRALRKHGGKVAPAALELDISRPTFYELMDKLGLRKEEAR